MFFFILAADIMLIRIVHLFSPSL